MIERPLTQTQRRCMQLSWHYFCGICQKVSRLQPSVNLHAHLQHLCLAALVPNVLPGGMKALVGPVRWSKPYSILASTQASYIGLHSTRTQAVVFKIISGNHYTTTAY